MRVADKMIYGQINDSLHRGKGNLAESLERAASQRRINKPSDDPVAATRVLAYRTDELNIGQYQKILTNAKSFLEYTDQSLGDVADVMVRAKELALSAANDASTNPDTRRILGAEINQLQRQVVQIGNRKLAGRFLFGGYNTTQPPFDPQGNYNGDDGEIKVPIDKEAFVAINLPGSRAFLGKAVGELLDKNHPENNPAGTIKDPNDPNNETPQNLMPESQDPQMRGPASVVPQVGVGTKKNDTKFASPSPRNQFGEENNSGINLFGVLKKLEVAMITGDKYTIQVSLDDLDEAHSQAVLSRSELGSRLMNLNTTLDSLNKSKVDTKGAISQLEDEDMFKVVSDVNKNEATLKASLSTSSKLMQPSLLDFLR
jgi:flagellar hook-associated protein 3 FlgL